MALVARAQSPFTINATDTYVITDVSDALVGTIYVCLDTTSAGTVSVVVKGRPRGIPLTTAAPAFMPIPYLLLTDGGTVAATPPEYASAALTGDGDQILIPATGMDIALDVTFTDGSHTVYYTKAYGASA